jgi:hypothetical protein
VNVMRSHPVVWLLVGLLLIVVGVAITFVVAETDVLAGYVCTALGVAVLFAASIVFVREMKVDD